MFFVGVAIFFSSSALDCRLMSGGAMPLSAYSLLIVVDFRQPVIIL